MNIDDKTGTVIIVTIGFCLIVVGVSLFLDPVHVTLRRYSMNFGIYHEFIGILVAFVGGVLLWSVLKSKQ
ncbi:MAG: hypothetical protein OEY96_06665 [Gammaproteobacteria bacterium]|nr:hypothetical protein [Gammaproteobacteria bacterium]